MTTLRYSRMAFVGVLSVLSATTASAMSCAIDANGKTTCPTSQQVEEFNRTAQPVACTMDAKQCPDGSYVGRVAPDCEFAACPGSPSCAPYVCMDGTTHPSCSEDGHVINYFAEPCLTHGGDAGPFTDVPANHANANAIAYMKAEGIVEGYADGTFRPDATINRAEFVKIVAGALYSTEEIQDCPLHGDMGNMFLDVARTAWFVPHLCTARLHNVIAGYPDGTFLPAREISFAEAAKIITVGYEIGEPPLDCNGAQGYEVCGGHAALGDVWYRRHIVALAERNAVPASIRATDEQITRGEMAEMIWRLKAGIKDLPSKTYEDLTGKTSYPLSTYTNESDGYSIEYPADWFVQEDVAFGGYSYDKDATGTVLSRESFASQNLDTSTSVRIAVIAQCPDLPRMRFNGGYELVLDGKTWSYSAGSEGAAGSEQAMGVYMYQKDAQHCYVVTTNDFRSTGDAYDQPKRSQVKHENEQMDLALRTIVSSIVVR